MTYRPEPDEEFSPRAEHARIPYARKRTTLRTMLLWLAALCVAAYSVQAMLPRIAPDTVSAGQQAAGLAVGWRDVTPQEAAAIMEQRRGDDAFMVLDVRTPGEFSEGHLQGARNIDFTSPEFRDRVRSLNRNRTYLVYCRSGNRSTKALEVFRELGFTSVLHMNGGTLAWNAAGLPLEK
ncbi:rhodanese-like domain-containing protein [Nitratidesulfovibrio liaohensis]|uniref:Rhodanese-like domain-containing protein n=1 Tax=Nitratidesulfovibrio liaohensis TaxID=2604158 RepID=A0ABY9QZJ8_9BACT|nr:rhodanese-like domain-containing protein [Nitratidesulfovibrio liaohensis]WMW64961.1 rhodanese-like domain-containing protein [Nitratidesulfovibrio liaohensis]